MPDPDGPITAVKLPGANANDTFRKAHTGERSPYTFDTDTSRSDSCAWSGFRSLINVLFARPIAALGR